MSFLHGFDDDIFISYAHIDNEPLAHGHARWVSSFHDALQVMIQQRLGVRASVWRDPRLQGNDYFADTLVGKLPKTAFLVAIMSPPYVSSDWCQRELQEFCKVASRTGGIRVDDKARVFKVLKTEVPLERHPPELQNLLGYEFYERDRETQRPREFSPDLGAATHMKYVEKLGDLAYDICQLLERLARGTTSAPTSGATVYLADTTADLVPARDRIKRELQERGHTVLPGSPLPLRAPDFQQEVLGSLQRSRLSIHLIGAHYGIIPEAESRSVVYLQNELAAARSADGDFSRIIWLPADLEPQEERQRQFIELLRSDPGAQKGAELLQTTLEELKTVIEDKLKNPPRPRPTRQNERGSIYLVCDRQDREAAAPLADYLYDAGYEVTLPVTEGDEVSVREDHKENLLLCDAVIIYYGSASELWFRAKLRDLQKIAGYGRSTPIGAKAIWVAAPNTADKQRLRTHDALVVRDVEPFSPAPLQPFLAQMAGRREG